MEMLRAKLSGSGKKVTIPKNPPTSFALLPQVTDDVRSLEVRWEGAYTIQEMLKLPSLPELVSELQARIFLHIHVILSIIFVGQKLCKLTEML